MSDIERFSNWCLVSHGHALAPTPTGLWVRHSDYERELSAANARIAELERQVADKSGQWTREANCFLYKEHGGSNGMACEALRNLETSAQSLQAQLAAAQAKIDSLMFEFCHDEMTPEQIAEWEKHQIPIDAAQDGLCRNYNY